MGRAGTREVAAPRTGALGLALSAALLAVAQAPHRAGALALAALVPWLVLTRPRAWAHGAATGFALGLAGAALGTPWIPPTMQALGASPAHASVAWAMIASWGLGLPWGLFGALVAGVARQPLVVRVGALALAIAALDLARSVAPGGLPWLLFGHSQASVPGVAQAAVVGGVPLLSGFLVASNVALAELVLAQDAAARRRAAVLAAALVGGYATLALAGVPTAQWARSGSAPPAAAPLEVLVVQPNLDPTTRWSPLVQRTNLAIVRAQTARKLARARRRPDLVLWPESMLTTPLERDPALARDLHEAMRQLGVPLVLGAARAATEGGPASYRSSALWVEPDRGVVAGFDKTRALPVIESASTFPGSAALAAAIGLARERPRVEEASEAAPLRGRVELLVALCAEVLAPRLVASRRSAESHAIVNLADDSWFAREAAADQALAFASFRAIEQRLWLVRAAQRGLSAVVDPYGRVTARLRFGEAGALAASLPREAPPGAAERAGLVALFAAGAAAGCGLASPLTRRRTVS